MTDERPRVLILTFAPVSSGPRPLKQLDAVKGRYHVTTAGVGEAPAGADDHVELRQGEGAHPLRAALFALVLLLRAYRLAFWISARNHDAWSKLRDREWDVIMTHDVPTVSLALRLRSRRGVILDLHEYAPRQAEHNWKWRLLVAPYFRWLLRVEVPRAAAVSCVAPGIAEAYRDEFGIDTRVVVNATSFYALEPTPTHGAIRLVHSGVAHPQRRLDLMIEAVRDTTANVTLDLYLVDTSTPYFRRLEQLAASVDRVTLRPAVPYSQLIETLNSYDVGLAVLPPTTFNLEWCLPNKFFDYLQARLGVVIGPSPEMVAYVERYGLGAVASGFDLASLVRALDDLTPEVVTGWKNQAHAQAQALSGEHQVAIWSEMVDRLAGDVL